MFVKIVGQCNPEQFTSVSSVVPLFHVVLKNKISQQYCSIGAPARYLSNILVDENDHFIDHIAGSL